MPQKMMWVAWEDGAELSNSHKSPGDYSPLTRDADKRLGQVVLSDIDDESVGVDPDYDAFYSPQEDSISQAEREPTMAEAVSEAVADVAAEVLTELITAGLEVAKPQVSRWWAERGRPKLKSVAQSTRSRFRRAPTTTPPDPEAFLIEGVTANESSAQLETSQDVTVITKVEAEQRLTAALLARAFSDEQVKAVLNARIVDEMHQEVHLSLEEVPRDEIEAQVGRLLEANPAMLAGLIGLFSGRNHRSESEITTPARASLHR